MNIKSVIQWCSIYNESNPRLKWLHILINDAIEKQAEYLTLYYLATNAFKEKGSRLTRAETEEVIDLYSKSIELNEKFADAYLMQGLAYHQLASALMRAYKEDLYTESDKKVNRIKETLLTGRHCLEKSVELHALFQDPVAERCIRSDITDGNHIRNVNGLPQPLPSLFGSELPASQYIPNLHKRKP